jgi:6-phosphogluconolactonase (cycloisomerase 2 family)/photosystem II stability/assembly factor-like uncharacterized protein
MRGRVASRRAGVLVCVAAFSLLLVSGVALAEHASPPIRYVDCFANTSEQGCAAIPDEPIGTVNSLAASPDGSSLYAATDSALTVFSRDREGELSYAGCFANLGDHGCETPAYNSLRLPYGVVVSPDGKSVYAIAQYSDAITAFNRAPDGSLTYAGCIANDGRAGCDTPTHQSISDPTALAISPDGRSVYVVSDIASTISRFDRAHDGSLTYRGCFADKGEYGCRKPRQDSIGFALGVTVTPDGRSVYVAGGGGSITIFRRATNGALRSSGCISDQGHNREGCKQVLHYPFAFTDGVVSSPDGRFLYSLGDDVVSVLHRHRNGRLSFVECFRAKGEEGCKPLGKASRVFLSALATSDNGRWLYVVDGNDVGGVLQFKVRSDGRLRFVKCVSRYEDGGCHAVPHDSLLEPNSIALSPQGHSLYLGTDGYPDPSVVHLELTPDPALAAKRTREPNSVSYWNPGHAILGTGDPYHPSKGTIQLSDDGGRTFHVGRKTDWAVTWVNTAGAQDAWAVLQQGRRDRRLLHSSDGGETWQPIAGRPPPQPSFGTPTRGLAVGDIWNSHLLATRDRGATWKRISSPCPDAENLGVAMASAEDLLIACGFNAGAGGESKRVFASSDGGKTWRKRAQVGFRRDERESGLEGVGYIDGLSFSPSGAGILFSDYSPLMTGNRGRDWTALDLPDGNAFSGQMFSRSTGVLLDRQHLIKTEDGGRTWALVHRFPH